MRLIIKEYLSQLKEKDELDLLLCDLLFQKGYVIDSRPKTGNRQYGVDIHARQRNETILFVVKQGNINRKMWSSDQNAVRQSIENIKDVYLRNMQPNEIGGNLRIIVATNGELDESVKLEWSGYVANNCTWNGKKLSIELWSADHLVDEIQRELFNEHIFDAEMQSLLRKALYFIEESDYKNIYFEKIVNRYLEQLALCDSKKKIDKCASSLYMASQMIAQYAGEVQKYKISIMASEYVLVRYWKFLLEFSGFEKTKYIDWLAKYVLSFQQWSEKYIQVMQAFCCGKASFPAYNPVEQRVMLYETIGYMASYAYHLSYKDDRKANKEEARIILDNIIRLINDNECFYYTPYDGHVGIICMLFRLLDRMGRRDQISILLNNQARQLMQYYIVSHKYPTPIDSFEDAVNIEFGNETEEYQTSGLWGVFLEWIVLLDEKNLYDDLYDFLKNDLKEVTKCTWYLRKEEETILYDAFAMNRSGTGVAIDVEKDFEAFVKKVNFVREQYTDELFSFDEYSAAYIEFIVCRYYGYIPRVKFEVPLRVN